MSELLHTKPLSLFYVALPVPEFQTRVWLVRPGVPGPLLVPGVL